MIRSRLFVVLLAVAPVACSVAPTGPSVAPSAVEMGTAAALHGDGPVRPLGDVYEGLPTPRPPTIDPTLTGTVEQAVAYVQYMALLIMGRTLTLAELNDYGAWVGYVDGQPVTGAMVNAIVATFTPSHPTT